MKSGKCYYRLVSALSAGILFFCLLIFVELLGPADVHADGRDTRAIRQCPKSETDHALSELEKHQSEAEWSKESRKAFDTILECSDGTFVLEKTLAGQNGDSYRIENYRFESLGISITYSSHGFISVAR